MKDLNGLFRKYAGVEPSEIVPLSGSASNRRYARIYGKDISYIGVKGTDPLENKAFVKIASHFRSKGIPVPQVLSVSEDWMSYLQDDLGDCLLSDLVYDARRQGGFDEESPLTALLCKTMAMLPKIQMEGAQGLDFSVCYPQPSFDREMIFFDLNYFKYCFLKPSGLEFNEVTLQREFEKLADDLLIEDWDAFLYRDFNARNVIIKDGQPFFIDFQGGRRGPIYYDVASFVWQARAGYPKWLKKRMIDSYLDALSQYAEVNRRDFESKLRRFILYRMLQVLGAYGFRGLVEQKAQFIVSIPQAMSVLQELLQMPFDSYPYLNELLLSLSQMRKFAPVISDSSLEVRVCSFSYKKGIPQDMSGNGGGYVFDCRYINNPGRYEPYKKLTGRDEPVISFLEEDGEIIGYLDHIYSIIDPHIETYLRRGFTSLTVSFGCTGGQHRSVYCAEHLARHILQLHPDVRVRLIHREQGIEEIL